MARDHHPLYFRGSLVEGRYAGVPEKAFHRKFLDVSISAKDLDTFVRNTVGHLRGIKFCLGRHLCGRFSHLTHLGRTMGQKTGSIDLSLHIGNHPLDGLKSGNRFSKLMTLFGIGN